MLKLNEKLNAFKKKNYMHISSMSEHKNRFEKPIHVFKVVTYKLIDVVGNSIFSGKSVSKAIFSLKVMGEREWKSGVNCLTFSFNISKISQCKSNVY